VVDGTDGARIGCRVSGATTFEVSGTAERGTTSFLVLDGRLAADGTGTATIAVAGPGTAGKQLTSAADTPCELFTARSPFQIAQGNVWAEFTCRSATNPTVPGMECSIGGEFVFENCER
jgi:hypothetical protein